MMGSPEEIGPPMVGTGWVGSWRYVRGGAATAGVSGDTNPFAGQGCLKSPPRAISGTTILIDHDIAMVDKEGRDFLARCGALRVVPRDFRATRLSFPVGCAFENDRKRPGNGLPCGHGAIDIARQLDPVPHRDHDIAVNPHVVVHTLTLVLDMAPHHASRLPLCHPPDAMTIAVRRRPR